MAITSVGSVDAAVGTALTTLTLAVAAAIGDVRILTTKLNSSTINVSSVAGGNVATWTKVQGPTNDTNGTIARHEMWIGTVANGNTSGHETITVTWSSSVTGIADDFDCKTLTNSNTATTWAMDGTQSGLNNNASSTTVTFPTLTAAGNGEAYVGYARCPSSASYSSPVSCTVETDIDGNPFVVNLNVSAGSITPTALANVATFSYSTAVLLVASFFKPPRPPNAQAAHRASSW